MSHRDRTIGATLLSVLAALSTAFARDPAPSLGSGTAGVELGQATLQRPAAPAREALPDMDARHCLEFPTNLQVIVCAEKYRPHRRKP
jgi:hypothetical protein